MRVCIDETRRRRRVQLAHNERHGIVPKTIRKSVEQIEWSTRVADARDAPAARVAEGDASYADQDPAELAKVVEAEMTKAAGALDFERAAALRDQLFELRAAAK